MNDMALKLIRPFFKPDQIVASFKEAILSGTIQPGASIVESKVAQQHGELRSQAPRARFVHCL